MSRRSVVVALTCVAFTVWVVRYALAHWDGIYDDAFIYLRYVRNLGAGCGLRFNCAGPAVEGFTSPLYLAVLWLGSVGTGQLIWLCQVVGTACVAGAGVVAIVVVVRLVETKTLATAALGIALAVAIGFDDYILLNSVTGMETAMGALVFALLAYAAVAQRRSLVIAATCAFVLVRPEAAVFVVALPLLPFIRRRDLLAVAVFVVVLVAVRFALFGVILPNTYYAKSGGTFGHFELGLAYLGDAIRDFPLAFLAPLALLGAHRRAVGYLLAGAALWLLYFLRTGGDTYEYSRLVLPLVPVLEALALAGVYALVSRWRPQLAIAATGALAAVIALRAAWVHHIPAQGVHPQIVEWSQIGTYLRTHEPRGTLVATVPIGAIGYYSSLPILDLVGLTEPEISREGRSVPAELLTKQWIGHERHNTEHVLARAPALIVTTMVRDRPWQTLAEAKAGFYADWLLLQEIKAGRAPYRVRSAEVAPGRHVLMFERDRSSGTERLEPLDLDPE